MTTYRLLIAIEHALPNWPLVDFRKYSFGRIMKIGQDANPSTALKQEKGALRVNPCLWLVV